MDNQSIVSMRAKPARQQSRRHNMNVAQAGSRCAPLRWAIIVLPFRDAGTGSPHPNVSIPAVSAPPATGWLYLALLFALLAGCSHDRGLEEISPTRVFDARPPAFLTGPVAVLLTNPLGFSARVELQSRSALDRQNTVTGTLLGSGNKLLFVPEADPAPVKYSRPGGFSFIWDAASQTGYVLSDALQGYAPVTAGAAATNIHVRPNSGPLQKAGAYTCEPQETTLRMSDGTSAEFRLYCATELKGFPVHISAVNNASPLTLTLSKIRLEPQPPSLFAPPEGFTKYPSPEVLADELAARQHNLRRQLREQRY